MATPHRTTPRQCESCGTTFDARLDHIRNGNGRFCSRSCVNKGKPKPESRRRVIRTCEQCGEVFERQLSRTIWKAGKFCSQPCYWDYKIAHFEENFWLRFDKSGNCWLWTGKVGNSGYGETTITRAGEKPKHVLTHRLAWTLTHGEIPPGMNICHRCDVKLCGNPDHLFPDTQRNNLMDMVNKGRGKLFKGNLRRDY